MMVAMPRPRPPHLHHEVDRHGSVRWYVRKGKGKRIRLREEYGSDAFWSAYRAAIEGQAPSTPRAAAGTLQALLTRYRKSAEWCALSLGTRLQREAVYRAVTKTAGDKQVNQITKAAIKAGMDRRKETPHAANTFLKAMKVLFRWVVDDDDAITDPTVGVRKIPIRDTGGLRAWTEEEVGLFEQRWPLGARERLALDILLYTGLRRGDAVRLGRQHVKDGQITIRMEKTRQEAFIPMMPALEASIAATPSRALAFIVTERGTPFGKASFGNWFRQACREAGVPGAAHGLRKVGARRLAENGATENQLNAIFGWSDGSRESATYVKSASRKRMAQAAAPLMLQGTSENKNSLTSISGEGTIANHPAKSKP